VSFEPAFNRPQPDTPGYQLLRKIGSGSFGDVWLARNEAGQLRAVKVIFSSTFAENPAHFQKAREGLLRYGKVADTYARLMQIHHAGQSAAEDYFYYVMELADDVTGQRLSDPDSYLPKTLQHMLCVGEERIRLPLMECARIGIELAEALEQLHQGGLVHRDIKPSNIVFVRNLASLADIDLVAVTGEGQTFTGTAGFIPPEGPGTKVADIFSLGRVLYEMATGRRTEDYPGPPNLKEADEAERKQFRSLNAILLKACHREPQCRFQSVAQLGKELQLMAAGESIEERRQLEEWRARMKRNMPRVAIGAVILVVAAFLVSGWISAKENTHQLQLLDRIRRAPRIATPGVPWFDGVWSNATAAGKIRRTDEVKNQAVARLSELDARVLMRENGMCASSVLFDRNGTRLLVGGYAARGVTHGAILWNLDTGARQTSTWARPGPVAFDVSGRALQVMLNDDRRSGQVWDVAKEERILKFEFESSLPPALPEKASEPVLAIAQDGSLVAASMSFMDGETNRTLFGVWDVVSGKRLWQIEHPASALAFSPDASLLAAGGEEGSITIWQAQTAGEATLLPASENKIESLTFHRDLFFDRNRQTNENWLLAAGENGGNVTLWDVARKIPRHSFPDQYWDVGVLAFNPSGTILAVGGRRAVHLWNVANGRLLLKIASGEFVTGLSFSPDGKRLAVSVKHNFHIPADFFVWELDPGRGVYALHGLRGPVATGKIRFSPDGSMVAALANNWQLGIWSLTNYEPRLLVNVPKGETADNAALAFSPSGREFAFGTASGARLWSLEAGRLEREWQLPPGLQENLAFQEPGKLLLFRVETKDRTQWPFVDVDRIEHPRVCRIRELLQPGTNWMRPLVEIPNFNFGVFHSAMTPDGKIVIVHGTNHWGGQGEIAYSAFDTLSGTQIWSRVSTFKSTFDLDPNGRLAVISPFANSTLIEAGSAKSLRTSKQGWGELGPGAARWLAMRSGDQKGRSVVEEGKKSPLIDLGIELSGDGPFVFSPDGKMVAWGGDDGTIFVCGLEEVRQRLAKIGLGW
jgi:WD40 repeat protein